MLRQLCDSSNKTDQTPYAINQERKKKYSKLKNWVKHLFMHGIMAQHASLDASSWW